MITRSATVRARMGMRQHAAKTDQVGHLSVTQQHELEQEHVQQLGPATQ